MDVRVEDLSPISKTLRFTVPVETVNRKLEQTYAALRKEVKLPGFRQGHVPRKVLEERFGPETAEQAAAELAREQVAKALVQHELEPVAEPKLERGKLRKGKPFKFSAVVELRPSISIEGYEGLSFSMEVPEADDGEIDTLLQSMRRQAAEFVPLTEDRPAGDGDVAEVRLTLRAEGYPDHVLENLRVGVPDDTSADFLKELVTGARPGESRSGTVSVPMSYPDQIWAGASCEATVELTGLTQAVVPDLDDPFAKKLGHESVAVLRTRIGEQLSVARTTRARNRAERALVEQLIERTPFELPPTLVQRRAEVLVQAIGAELMPGSLGSGGPGLDDLEDDKRADVLQEAEFAVRRELLLQEVAKREKLEVAEEARQARIDGIAQQTGQSAETVRSYLVDRGGMASLDARLLEDQAMALLVERASDR